MPRCIFLILFSITEFCLAQIPGAGRMQYMPAEQLELKRESDQRPNRYMSTGYMHNKFKMPDFVPLVVPTKNLYYSKHVSEINVFDPTGKLVYSFYFSPYGNYVGAMTTGDHKTRWYTYIYYYPPDSPVTRVEAHYNKDDKIAKRDSVITTVHTFKNADTTITYETKQRWTYLSGSTINERNQYFNDAYYKNRITAPDNGLNAQFNDRFRKGHVYLKKKLPTNYKSDSAYLDDYFEIDENLLMLLDSGRKQIDNLPSTHAVKKKYNPLPRHTYGTGSFDEPTWIYESGGWCPTAIGRRMMEQEEKKERSYYMCTLTRRNLMDSIFFFDYPLIKDSVAVTTTGNYTHFYLYADKPKITLAYTLKYKYDYNGYFNGNEYEREPQIVLIEQLNKYGKAYYRSNFNKEYHVPEREMFWPADVSAFVKNKVKRIHVDYQGTRELAWFELDTIGNIIGGMNWYGENYWKDYKDKNGNRFLTHTHYNEFEEWLERKDSSAYIKHLVKNGDTTITFSRNKSFVFKTGKALNERNKEYNKKYLHKLVKDEMIGRESRIYLNQALKTNFNEEQLYLSIKSVGDYDFNVKVGTTDITDSIPETHRLRKLLIRPEIPEYLVSGEDFIPPYEFNGPFCGGSGGRDYKDPDWRALFNCYSWSLNEKGLYDTCYKTDPVIPKYIYEGTGRQHNPSTPKEPVKWPLYTVRYEYY